MEHGLEEKTLNWNVKLGLKNWHIGNEHSDDFDH